MATWNWRYLGNGSRKLQT